jgi:rare lipoprotein A
MRSQRVLKLLFGCASSHRVVSQQAGTPREPPKIHEGLASYYARSLHGNATASGEIYDENTLTAAHRTFEFGTSVRVTSLSNGQSVVVRINDRGPHVEGRIIDLSYRAAEEIGLIEAGVAPVRLEILD